MTEEEIKALIKSSLEAFSTTFSSQLNTTIGQIVTAQITPITQQIEQIKTVKTDSVKTEDKADDQKTTIKDTVKALQQQLADLQTQSAEKEKRALQAEFKAELGSLLGSVKDLRTPGIVKELLTAKWGEKVVKGEDGQFLLKDGENVKILKSEFDGFFATDEGKALIAVKTPNATNVTTQNQGTNVTPGSKGSDTTGKTSLDLFGDFSRDLQSARN
jgi:FlxA-like protein